jgi:hypothetical protein
MMKRKEFSRQALLVALVALMLAVPFSCLLGRVALWCLEPRKARREAGLATPLPARV